MLKKYLILVALLLCVTLFAGLAICYAKPDWVFLVQDTLVNLGKKPRLEEYTPTKTETYNWDRINSDSRFAQNQALLLINTDYALPARFSAELTEQNGVELNVCMAQAWQKLHDAMERRFDKSLRVMSHYRTAEEQEDILESDNAFAAEVGASEHQAGLALDLYAPYYAGRAFLKTDVGQAVNRDAWQYGFIIRYPYYGESETGIPFEPWHIRYVGAPHAELITNGRLTMETYIAALEPGRFYCYGNYIITCQTEAPFQLPQQFSSVTVSPDNRGNWIFTICK